MQFRVDFTDSISITYTLVNEEIVDSWAEIIKSRTINDLCPHNHYIGYVSDDFLTTKINRLYDLADLINDQTPERVIKVDINKDTYQAALNTMHVHFPLLKNDTKYKHLWGYLSEYNDIIHWLESTVRTKWGNANGSESRMFRITLDFNKSNPDFRPIPDSAYKLFDPNILFGELKIHYTHVGRNAHELYINRDIVCPPDQFVPQRTYTASTRMYFTDDFYMDRNSWEEFYDKRGRNFWGMDINDPKIAFGYIKIGELSRITINGYDVDIPKTPDDRHNFRKQLVNTKVIGWEII